MRKEAEKIVEENLIGVEVYMINKIIILLFMIMPIVESLNGFFSGLGLSDIYRLTTVVVISCYFMMKENLIKKYNIYFLILLSVFMCILVSQFLFFHQNKALLMSDLKSVFRILLAPFYFCYFYEGLSSQEIKREDLKKIILIYGILYSSLIIIPYLCGTGFVSYDIDHNGLMSKASEVQGVGNKGFFIELNSLIAILAANLFFIKNLIISYFNENEIKKAVTTILLYIATLISLFITATKLGILLSIVCSLIFVYQIFCSSIKREYKLYFAASIVLLFIAIYIFLGGLITDITNRLNYFSEQSNGSTIDFLTSNRLSYLTKTMYEIDNSTHRFFLYLFGAGYSSPFTPTIDGIKRSIVEIDYFDFLFSYGFFGFISYIAFFKKEVILLFFSKKNEMKSMLIIFLIYSFMGGHIFVNSMTATFLAIFLSYSSDAGLKSIK